MTTAPADASVDARGIDDSDEIPCEPRAVLQTVCQQCHTSPPVRSAPFPIVTLTDVRTMRSGGVVRDLMIAQLMAHRMPLAPVTIDDSQRATLLAWLQSGAPAVTARTCDGTADAAADVADGDAMDAEADALESGVDAADAAAD